jgi:transcriptional regulator with XRE-family HTH domain
MARKQSPTTPLARRLDELVASDPVGIREYLGCTSQAISQYRTGTSRPTLENLCKIATYFNVSTDYLLGRTDSPAPTVNAEEARQYTGLSLDALEVLHSYQESAHSNTCLRLISDIISGPFAQNTLCDSTDTHSNAQNHAQATISPHDV